MSSKPGLLMSMSFRIFSGVASQKLEVPCARWIGPQFCNKEIMQFLTCLFSIVATEFSSGPLVKPFVLKECGPQHCDFIFIVVEHSGVAYFNELLGNLHDHF